MDKSTEDDPISILSDAILIRDEVLAILPVRFPWTADDDAGTAPTSTAVYVGLVEALAQDGTVGSVSVVINPESFVRSETFVGITVELGSALTSDAVKVTSPVLLLTDVTMFEGMLGLLIKSS